MIGKEGGRERKRECKRREKGIETYDRKLHL
jgi:hypothetical protein